MTARRRLQISLSTLRVGLITASLIITIFFGATAYRQWVHIKGAALSTLHNQVALLAIGVEGFFNNYRIAARGLNSRLQMDPDLFAKPHKLQQVLSNVAQLAPAVEAAGLYNADHTLLASYTPKGPLPRLTRDRFYRQTEPIAVGVRLFAYGHWLLPLRIPLAIKNKRHTFLVLLVNLHPLLKRWAQAREAVLHTQPSLSLVIVRNDGFVLFSNPLPHRPTADLRHFYYHVRTGSVIKSMNAHPLSPEGVTFGYTQVVNQDQWSHWLRLSTIPATAVASLSESDLLSNWYHDVTMDGWLWLAMMALTLLTYKSIGHLIKASQESKTHLQALRRVERMYQALISVDALLLHQDNEEKIFQSICDTLIKTSLFDVVGIATPNSYNKLRFVSIAGPGSYVINAWQNQSKEEDSVAWFAENARELGTAQISNDLPNDPRYLKQQDNTLRRERAVQWRSVGAFPILREHKPHSILVLINQSPHFFNDKLQDLGQRLAEMISFSLDSMRLQKIADAEHAREAYFAYHDALTSLPNRHAVLLKIPEAMARARRNERMFVVCMLDLDNFKPVNDTYGHAAGDAVLKEMAVRFESAVRETDTVARLGGDEFIFLLEDIDRWDNLERVMTRVLNAVSMPITLVSGEIVELNASIGVTVYPLDDVEPEILLRHADIALYEQKRQKYNREHSQRWEMYELNSKGHRV